METYTDVTRVVTESQNNTIIRFDFVWPSGLVKRVRLTEGDLSKRIRNYLWSGSSLKQFGASQGVEESLTEGQIKDVERTLLSKKWRKRIKNPVEFTERERWEDSL